MSCWVKQIILDTQHKELHLYTHAAIPEQLQITTHWFDYYRPPTSTVMDLGNRYGESDDITPVVVVSAPTPVNCWKREITSMTVYNPNGFDVRFYVAEYDDDTGVTTIIVDRVLPGFETWTLECICTCCNTWPSWPPAEGVTVTWNDIGVGTNITRLNFDDCLTAAIDAINPAKVNIGINLALDFNCDIDAQGNPTAILDICGQQVDMSCIFDNLPSGCPCPIPVDNVVFVMKNGDDATWELWRFELPFETINWAIAAAHATGDDYLVVIYPWEYDEIVTLKDRVFIWMNDGVILNWGFFIEDDNIWSEVTGFGNVHLQNYDVANTDLIKYDTAVKWNKVKVSLERLFITAVMETFYEFDLIDKTLTTWENRTKLNVKEATVRNLTPHMIYLRWYRSLWIWDKKFWRAVDISIENFFIASHSISFSFFDVASMDDIYIHASTIQAHPLLPSVSSANRRMTNRWQNDCNIYHEHVKVYGPFYVPGGFEAQAIYIPRSYNSRTSFNSCQFYLTTTTIATTNNYFSTVDVLGNGAGSNNIFHFYEDTIIHLGDQYTHSLYAPPPLINSEDYNAIWWVYTNKPFSGNACGYYTPAGVERIVETQSIHPLPTALHKPTAIY